MTKIFQTQTAAAVAATVKAVYRTKMILSRV